MIQDQHPGLTGDSSRDLDVMAAWLDLHPQAQGESEPHLDYEAVDHPAHYGGGDNPYEAIKVIEALGWGEGFVKGNAIKYLMRAGSKPDVPEAEDLRKAIWYIERRLGQVAQIGAESDAIQAAYGG